mmetsp:Transcript_28501/g.71749  ORF Transcript_28501/g.71749 Transcript_28501/m.71749 type:complete len:223 (+) Transcript_28501:2091-2759(+)
MIACSPTLITVCISQSSAAGFSAGRTAKKAIASASESFVSASSLTISGSRSPARANSASAAGMVAETRTVCLRSGIFFKISWSCTAKPSSNRRSASSKTTYSQRANESSASCRWCIRRPGVAISASGLRASRSNWSSIESPPTSRQSSSCGFKKWPSSLANLSVCTASSRVGDSTIARTPTVDVCARSFSSMGTRKAAVLPEPVRAIATTSRPVSSSGIALR